MREFRVFLFFFLIIFPFRIFLTLKIDTKKARSWYSWSQIEQWNLNDLTRTSNYVFVGIGILGWMDHDSIHCTSFCLFFIWVMIVTKNIVQTCLTQFLGLLRLYFKIFLSWRNGERILGWNSCWEVNGKSSIIYQYI